jgi:transposase InsO family protein
MQRREIREIIETWRQCGGNASEAARRLGIDRRTVSRWVQRGRQPWGFVRWRGIQRLSTEPRRPRRTLNREQVVEVLAWRRKTGYCREKAAAWARKNGISVSASTLHRLFLEHGLVRPTPHHRRPRFQNGRAMRPSNTTSLGYLQMDVKYVTPELSGLPYTCYQYACIDILSRYKVALLLPVLDEAGSIVTLRYAFQAYPFPVRYVQTDNGLEFQTAFHALCSDRGIEHYHIHKNSPNENAVIERSFRTDQDEFFYLLEYAPNDINELNRWFQQYLIVYNTVRPHMGLNMLTPKEAIALYQKS